MPNRAFDRIDHRWKLKQHAVARGLDDAAPVFRHESISDHAVFAKCTDGADLVDAHEARVTDNISRNYGR
jgi:hypothetical protein